MPVSIASDPVSIVYWVRGIANAKNVLYQTINDRVLKAREKRSLADVNCYCKMKSFLRLKGVTNTCKRIRYSPTIGGISSVQWRKVGKAEDFKCVLIVYCMLGSK